MTLDIGTDARERYEEAQRLVAGDTIVVTINAVEREMTLESYLADQIDKLRRLIDERLRRVASIEQCRAIPRGPQSPRVRQFVEADGRRVEIKGAPEPPVPA